MHSPTPRELLHQQSYKATPSRLAIMKVLTQAAQPLRASEILQKVGQRYDQATVYRTLATLKKIGVIKQIDFQHGVTYYESTALGDHHHVVCLKCERVADVADCCVAEDMDQQALKQSNFAAIMQHSLEFYGLCKSCS